MRLRFLLLLFILFLFIAGVFDHVGNYRGSAEAVSKDSFSAEGGNGTLPSQPFDKYFQEYFTVSDIETNLLKLEDEYPDLVSVEDIALGTPHGSSWQGRPIWAVKISDDVHINDPDEPDTLILGNVHAREWMGFEVTMYFIYHLLENYGQPPTDNDNDGLINEDMFNGVDDDSDGLIDEDWSEGRVTWLVNNREIWVVPTYNPDGTAIDIEMNNAGSGSWRKNARDNNGNGQFDSDYDGVDLNRNYPFRWDANQQGIISENGVEYRLDSSMPNSGTYRGPQDNFDDDGDGYISLPDIWDPRYRTDRNKIDEDPWDGMDNDGDGKIDEDKDGGFSEPETQAVEFLMMKLDSDGNHHNMRSDVGISLSYHSVGGWVIWPWGWTNNPTPNEDLILDVGNTFMDMTGYASWEADDMYMVSGDATDWLYGSHGVLAYTIELNDEPNAGFHPEPELIINTSRKMLSVNLFTAEHTGTAKIARDSHFPDLDIGLPRIIHDYKYNKITNTEAYKVLVEVENYENLNPNSLKLYYRVGTSGIYRTVRMQPLQEFESTDEENNIVALREYVGYIPSQPNYDDITVYYYIAGNDVRGPLVAAPVYGEGEPYTYRLDSRMGFSSFDAAVAALMAIIFITIVWGGFFKGVHIAVKADRRKAIYK